MIFETQIRVKARLPASSLVSVWSYIAASS